MSAPQQPAQPKQPKQRMAGDAFLNGGFYSEADKAITQQVLNAGGGADDSASAQTDFVGQQQGMNRVAQKEYKGLGKQTANNYSGFRGGDVNMQALQSRIDNTTQNLKDMATVQEVKTYGDRAAGFNYKPFVFGDKSEPVKSNASEIAKEYKKDLK